MESNGEPNVTALASVTVPASSIPDYPNPGWVPVTFTPPAPVVAGTQYAIVAYSPSFEAFLWGAREENPYPSGSRWSSLTPPPPWEHETSDEPDFDFKTYVAAREECSMASGHGTVNKQGEAGHLGMSDSLNTNLAEPQRLIVNHEHKSPQYHLVSLQQATCTGAAGERIFHGMGAAVRNSKKGYTVSFSIKEEAGGFFYESKVMKGAEEIEVNGGPLKTKTQAIS